MKPLLTLAAAAVSAMVAAGSSSASAQAPSKPNILYIVADDLGWADVGFHGAEIKTPSLDQLANEGMAPFKPKKRKQEMLPPI